MRKERDLKAVMLILLSSTAELVLNADVCLLDASGSEICAT